MGKRARRLLFTALAVVVLGTLALWPALRTVSYQIESDKISRPVRLALLSDLHSCYYGEGSEQLLDALERENPDAVLLGGDIFDDILPHGNSRALLPALAARWPCYYVTGNHEYWSGEAEALVDFVSGCGIKVLRGEREELEVNGQTIYICGVDDPDSGGRNSGGRESTLVQLRELGELTGDGRFSLLLAHRPELIDTYRQYGFDLVLSGHAHGGQWRIPGILNGLYAPNQGFFPAYAGGRYDFEDTIMIVSRGLARETTIIPRIFNRPELVIVELTPGQQGLNSN